MLIFTASEDLGVGFPQRQVTGYDQAMMHARIGGMHKKRRQRLHCRKIINRIMILSGLRMFSPPVFLTAYQFL
jgi:hypothetical protein